MSHGRYKCPCCREWRRRFVLRRPVVCERVQPARIATFPFMCAACWARSVLRFCVEAAS